MFIYLASSPVWRALHLGKIGYTEEPYGRQSTYLTGCPPGLTPSYDMDYDALWETTATNKHELMDQEEEVHDHFLRYRMMREKPGDSEWFDFQTKIPYEEVKQYMDSRTWVKRQVPLSEIAPPKRTGRYMQKYYHKNLQFIKHLSARNTTLNALQEPIVAAITSFVADTEKDAGYVTAPCGSGKTKMTVKAMRNVRKCIICCPSKQIQNQWRDTFVQEGVFSHPQIYIVGGAGTTDSAVIQSILKQEVFCLISTYMSSHILADSISKHVDILVLDEAHHMAGIVAKEDKGEGRTRRLMLKAADLGIKRLSLTYTPRFIVESDLDKAYLTMDDDAIFGPKIAELKIRDLIRKGVLPDYRLWTLRDEARKGTGILGKAECILEAWQAREIVRKHEQFILHHLIIFAATTQEAKDLENFFQQKTTETLVLRVEEGDKLEDPIRQFTSAPRAILINCFVLNEGVDIPIANAVAITYPKQSRGQITQMILRAGRWYTGKSVFHILIPTLGDEDLSGFEEVLCALASCDEHIRDEIMLRAMGEHKSSDPLPPSPTSGDTVPECIVMEQFEANEEDIKKCFTNIRKNLFPAKESRRIRALCIEKGIDTSIEYVTTLRKQWPELPDDPRPKGVLWFDYLHPSMSERISGQDFVKNFVDLHKLRVGDMYEQWRSKQSAEVASRLPSIQHILDGYFGNDDTNFNSLCDKFGKKMVTRGR